jgi:N-methylhydantoinase B
VLGGKPGARSRKLLERGATVVALPSKADSIDVAAGDRLRFITWGGGGWGHPFDRNAEAVARDVRMRLITQEAAEAEYGVIVREGRLDPASTARKRATRPRREQLFDTGPPIEDALARCEAETGLKPPRMHTWSR